MASSNEFGVAILDTCLLDYAFKSRTSKMATEVLDQINKTYTPVISEYLRFEIYRGLRMDRIAAAKAVVDSFVDHYVSMGTHTGTHIDAPLHMLEAGKSLDQFPIDKFIGRGRYIRLGDGFDVEALKQAKIQAGDIILFHTGMSDFYGEPAYYESYPVLSEEVARYLVESEVKMIGLDTGSADNVEAFPIHKILLGGEVLIIENLTNLSSLANIEFTVYALPIKFELDGAPARVIAMEN
jgi:arylformamidase